MEFDKFNIREYNLKYKSEEMIEKWKDPVFRQKMHFARIGRPAWNKGKKCPQISEATKGRVPWNKDKKGLQKWSEEQFKKQRKIMIELWKNPEFREKNIKNSLKMLIKRPTSLEQKFIELIEKYNLPYRYVGNGGFLIGFKNPDFVNMNEKNCIEVANTFHHDNNWWFARIDHFVKYGWKCLVIWDNEFFEIKSGHYYKIKPNWDINLLNKIETFEYFARGVLTS